MKRGVELQRLSMDHHQALVVAKKARQVVDSSAQEITQVWNEIQAKYKKEMEQHFQMEEKFLLPALNAAGLETHVERVLYEHQQLREMLAQSATTPGHMREFAELLKSHVRFEERELFSAAEECLSEAVLKKIRHKLEAA